MGLYMQYMPCMPVSHYFNTSRLEQHAFCVCFAIEGRREQTCESGFS